MPVAGADQRQPASLRPIAQQRLARHRAAQVLGQRACPCARRRRRPFPARWPTIEAQSPAAKISGSVSLCRVSLTRMKPSSSSASPVSRQPRRAAGLRHPDDFVGIQHFARPRLQATGTTRLTSALRCTVTPRSARTPTRRPGAPWHCAWAGFRASAENRWKRSSSGIASQRATVRCAADTAWPASARRRRRRRRPRRWWSCRRCRRTRSSRASQRSLKRRIGLTGTACSLAPATRASCGVEPMLIDSAS